MWFGDELQKLQQYLKKGKLVSIEGALRIDEYEKNGQTREWVEVVAENFQMLDRQSDNAMGAPQDQFQTSQEFTN